MPGRAIKKINENNLIKILNLLDSPIEGEFLAAAKSVARYLKSHGASWNEVVHKASPPYPSERQAPGFIGLRDSVILKRTSRAGLVTVKLTNGLSENLWFPCSTLRKTEGKRTARGWNFPAHSGGC